MGHPEDKEFLDAKLPHNLANNTHRTMSNNTVLFSERPSKEKIAQVFKNVMENGEPGFFNLQSANKRRPNVRGTNPCSEILLDSKAFCNLSSVVVTSHIKNEALDLADLYESVRLATRVGIRQTNVTVSLPEWDKVQKRDRLTGVSFTGWMEAFDKCSVNFDSSCAKLVLEGMRKTANTEADVYAYVLRIPRPLLVTCIKPEGTLSQLPTVSSGLHRSFAPFYIRRIRISSMDPVAKALQQKGMVPIPDPNKSERLVFEFPIKTGAKMSANDESAQDQLNRYLIMQKHYADHNSSCTLTIAPEEVEGIVNKVYEEWDNIVACAWLPKWTTAYPLMPYEACSEEEYLMRKAALPILTDLAVLVNEIEVQEFEAELDEDPACVGACPVR
jgi:adenosylcobalamin-dependent ribonucleoside-triphosphate reductase